MELLRISPLVILITQLSGAHANLPLLPFNRLRTGADKEYPDAKLIDCEEGKLKFNDFHAKETMTPKDALTRFQTYPFTSQGVIPGTLTNGGIGKFSFVLLRYTSRLRQMVSTRTGHPVRVLRVQQGRYVDVLQHPTANQPHYVFTPDYSGCAWTVTPMGNGMLRMKHVEGGHENRQFNYLPNSIKGGPVSYGMQFRDYGYVHKHGQLVNHATAYAYMHYANERWTLYVQHQTCAPRPGNTARDSNGLITSMTMNYFNQKRWDAVTGVEFFEVNLGQPRRLELRSN